MGRESRQPSAGPSRIARRRTAPIAFDDVIELTDSEDDFAIKCPPQKRQKVIRTDDDADTIDLTILDSAGPSTTTKAQASFEAVIGIGKGKDKALDVTNDKSVQSIQSGPEPASFVLEDTPASQVLQEPEEPLDQYLAQVLEVVPDVQPEHARALLVQHYLTRGPGVVETVLHILFEEPYPKVERNKGKRKRDAEASVDPPAKKYRSIDRPFEGGPHYGDVAFNQLKVDFPRIPVAHIRDTSVQNNGFYVPTYLMLSEQMNQVPPPFKVKTSSTKPSGKGKHHDPEFEREMAWLLEFLEGKAIQDVGQLQQNSAGDGDDDDGECEDGVECGCCFSTYAFDKMVQCPDAHLFCKSCMRSYVGNQLGQHDPNIICMDQSGCKLAFAESELRRFLSPKLLDLYERVKQTKEIEAAGLDGLEECPFCEYKVVIENPDEKLFRCEREECGAVSCRACKKLDHLPKSCKEAEEDKGLTARHKVEEAMTEALMRNCPKCKKAFVKESGCNKMTCPNCRTLSCYVCREIIVGYDHFDSRPPRQNQSQAGGSGKNTKCLLWDPVEQRHDKEVAAAREKAIKEVEATDPEVDKKQLEVELPRTAQPANNARAGQLPLGGLRYLVGGMDPVAPDVFALNPYHHHYHHHHHHHHHHHQPGQQPIIQQQGQQQPRAANAGAQQGVPALGGPFDFNFNFPVGAAHRPDVRQQLRERLARQPMARPPAPGPEAHRQRTEELRRQLQLLQGVVARPGGNLQAQQHVPPQHNPRPQVNVGAVPQPQDAPFPQHAMNAPAMNPVAVHAFQPYPQPVAFDPPPQYPGQPGLARAFRGANELRAMRAAQFDQLFGRRDRRD